MSFALGVAGPSRRLVVNISRARLRITNAGVPSGRCYRTTAFVRQESKLERDEPDVLTENAHRDVSSPPLPPRDRLKPGAGADPRTTQEADPNPWSIPHAWRSQLDPEAPWRKALLDRRRRWSEQAGQQLTAAGLKLNEVTGYHEVERLKALVGEKETRLKWLREDAKTAKEEYERAVTTRSTTQADVNSLLERKHAWSDEDVSRFTQLVRSDHTSNQNVSTTSATLRDTELAVDKAFNELMQAILQRYHEEQVWSDKIRNVSTYANLMGLLINLVVFVGAIAFVEPWKRRRLVERLEERIAGLMAHVEGSITGLGEELKSIRVETGIAQPVVSSDTHNTLDAEAPILTPIVHSPSIIANSLDKVSPLLDRVAPPSHDRDVIFSASVGATAGIVLSILGIWLSR